VLLHYIYLTVRINALLAWYTGLCDWKGRSDGKHEIEVEGGGEKKDRDVKWKVGGNRNAPNILHSE
jgi:hypothetical protein